MDNENCSELVLSELRGLRSDMNDFEQATQSNIHALNRLAEKLGDYIDLQSKSIPLKLVFLLFALVFGLVFGIELVQHFLKVAALV